jgi:hypothetical protein
MDTSNYLDLIKQKLNLSSDYAIAQKMGWSKANVSHYRNRKSTFENIAAVQVADTLGIDKFQVICDMELQREKNEEKRRFWLKYAQAICLVGIIAPALMTDTSNDTSLVQYQENIHIKTMPYPTPKNVEFVLCKVM